MTLGRCVAQSRLMCVALAVGTLLGGGISSVEVSEAQGTQKVEIVIQNGEAKLVHGTMFGGVPTELSIRNEDSVTHGFNSSVFGGVGKVEMVGGSVAEGKGANVYRVEPGRTMVIKFTIPLDGKGESRTHAFWCDMHKTVKGEMLLVEQIWEGG
ncbi:MAG: hypothetical protein NW202_12055 [Nitrospira sp.]|nr:hypothetical protein [Nitrospira sp.]